MYIIVTFISHTKVFALLEFHLHNFQPSVNTVNQQVQLTG